MRLQLSTWPEVAARLERDRGVLIPLGSTEQHGPTGLIGTDALVSEGIALRAAHAGDILVAPTLAYTPAQFNLDFPGTVSIAAATFAEVIADVVGSLARSGFDAFYFLNGHGATIGPVRSACHDIHQRRAFDATRGPSIRFQLRSWWDLPETDALRTTLYGDGEGMHATPSEISITRALFPDREPRTEMAPWSPLPPAYFRNHAGDAHDDAGTHRRAFPDGRVGSDAALASISDGEALLDAAARELVTDFRRFVATDEP